jgi:hypothetical protein
MTVEVHEKNTIPTAASNKQRPVVNNSGITLDHIF